MKRYIRKKLFSMIGLMIFLTLVFSAFTAAAEFKLGDDGGVTIGDKKFASKEDYIQSDYFRQNGMRCGAKPLQGVADLRLEKSVFHCTKYLTSIQAEYYPSAVFEIPVWWHVIYTSSGTGNISDAAITAQMAVLNEDYRAMAGTMGANSFDVKIQFVLAGIERVQNDGWFSDSEADEESYKKALGKDPNTYLNIYTNDASGYLGYAYFPQDSAGQWWDGIVLDYGSVGGRNNGYFQYNQGRTLVHEMGHYLGLYHTFQGGCTNSYSSGDLIVDTNAEAAPNYGCSPVSTCGNPDPINNYMDYSEDICMFQFTREQANRAVCSLVNYRPALYSVAAGDTTTLPPLLLPLIMSN